MSIWTKIKGAAKSVYYKVTGTAPKPSGFTPTYTGTPSTATSYPSAVSGGGIKVTSPTTTTSGGGGGIRVVSPTPTTTIKSLSEPGFTGKVEEVSPTGEVKGTTFVYGGKRIAGYRAGDEYFTPEADKEKDKKTYELEFEGGGIKEKVSVSPQELFWGYKETPPSEITPLGISDEPRGIIPFVGGVVETIKTVPTYQEGFIGIKEEFKQAFPKTSAKVEGGLSGVWEQVRWLGPEQIKYAVEKGRETEILPSAGFYQTPEGKKATQTTEILLMGALATPAGLGKQLIVETVPLRQPIKPYAVEEIQTAVVKGKPIRFSDYAIITEKHPPRVQITTTLTRSQMGKKPLDVKYLPEKITRTGTPFGATAQEPFIVVEAPKGVISKVTGVSQRLDVMKFEQLPPTQKFLVKRLAEAKAGGRPVADSRVIKMFGREDLKFASQIEVEQLAKMKPDPYFLRLKRVLPERTLVKPGKAIRRYEAVTETKLLKETELYEFTKSRILFKDVTFPGARAAGKTPELKVFTIEYKQPIIIGKEKVTGIIKPADIIKTPLDKTFQLAQEKALIPRAPPPRVPKAIVTTKIISPPKQVEAITRMTSAYAGTGMYERTMGGQLPAMRPAQIQRDIVGESMKISPREIETQLTKTIPKQIIKSRAKTVTKLTPKEITKEMTKEISKTVQKQSQKLIQKQIQKPMQKIIQKPLGFPREPFIKTPPHKVFPLFIPPLFGQLLPQKGVVGSRLFRETPSLFQTIKFELGYKVPKTPKVFAETGLVGFGIGEKLPEIELGSLLGKVVKKTKNKNKIKKKNRRKKK